MNTAKMTETPKVLYIIVIDVDNEENKNDSFRYTRSVLHSSLQLMGCKARHTFKGFLFPRRGRSEDGNECRESLQRTIETLGGLDRKGSKYKQDPCLLSHTYSPRSFQLSTVGGRLVISSDGVWDALSSEAAMNCCRGMSPAVATSQIVHEVVQFEGLRDDTTCIVIDILPPKELTPLVPPLKKHGKGVFKNMFRKKPSKLSLVDKDYSEPDVVEEIYEESAIFVKQRKKPWRGKDHHVVHMVTDKLTNKPRGYAFIEYAHTWDMKCSLYATQGLIENMVQVMES
ncbi:hypothetical protein IFM89_011200 [Coptis chinensis]|uniref:PPM-type phosphatase domain-containing protein n=1 Tax=Coptis chinensis TaxID=261450 RepID=A0A835HLN8_9MAGN|nr:hypothetical protein IFM89_011200 [Coptis chinensis]